MWPVTVRNRRFSDSGRILPSFVGRSGCRKLGSYCDLNRSWVHGALGNNPVFLACSQEVITGSPSPRLQAPPRPRFDGAVNPEGLPRLRHTPAADPALASRQRQPSRVAGFVLQRGSCAAQRPLPLRLGRKLQALLRQKRSASPPERRRMAHRTRRSNTITQSKAGR